MREIIKFILALLHPRARLKKQIEYYRVFKDQWHGDISSNSDVRVLRVLLKYCKGNKITQRSLLKFEERHVQPVWSTWRRGEMRKAVRSFLRFCRARGYECINPDCITDQGIVWDEINENKIVLKIKNSPGHPPKVALIRKAKKLRAKKFSYREIAEKLKRHHSQIHAWCNNLEYKWIK